MSEKVKIFKKILYNDLFKLEKFSLSFHNLMVLSETISKKVGG